MKHQYHHLDHLDLVGGGNTNKTALEQQEENKHFSSKLGRGKTKRCSLCVQDGCWRGMGEIGCMTWFVIQSRPSFCSVSR